ncbi:hypothetical protein [Defluviimonas sp. SAOS-178_SWC]|uniref:hypothetical protein n=1 Tax=Defluviimonas sp. SAOS-178_SWC TaxID=3121287 RepID=UPI0032218D7F
MSMKSSPLGSIDPSLRGKVVVGISWFEQADYAAARAIMTDDVLPASHDLWLQKARKSEREAQEMGYRTVRAVIDPKTFPAWCAENGFPDIDAKARMAFANHHAAGQIRN